MNAKPAALIACATLAIVVSAAHGALVQRTFVASNGVDGNPCSIIQPCRSFGTAIGKTVAGGEVIVQDSAGYGIVTITKSVSIIAPTGVYAGITVMSGQTGVTVDGAGVTVALRGLSISVQTADNSFSGNGAYAIKVQGYPSQVYSSANIFGWYENTFWTGTGGLAAGSGYQASYGDNTGNNAAVGPAPATFSKF